MKGRSFCLLIWVSSCFRIEHEAFTDKEKVAFKQLVRVMISDFLPFVKRTFDNLYPEDKVSQLALSTPYALRHRHAVPLASGRGIYKAGVDLRMELNVRGIGEGLRSVAPDVFEDLEPESERLELELDESQDVAVGEGSTEAGGGAMESRGPGETKEECVENLNIINQQQMNTGLEERTRDVVTDLQSINEEQIEDKQLEAATKKKD